VKWVGDTPAAWHHYFEPLAAFIEPGYFVDVGAGDGVFSSNTFFLERQRCWKGVAIEPAADEYPKLERQRPGSTVVHGAVCEKDGYKLYQDVTLNGHWTGWSGFRDTFDQHHAHQVDANVRSNKGWAATDYKVHCFRLQTLLDMEKRQHVTYLTISVEGHELPVLRSVQWDRVTVDVLEVAVHSEVDRGDITSFLLSKGYGEDTKWPHSESLVFLHPTFRRKLAAVTRGDPT
jgi:FkbM family methyltransferase